MGMVVGLLISGAMFFHKMKLQTLEAELLGDISYHETAAKEERSRRELAEQLQSEADTERTKIQSQIKDMSGSVLEAKEAKKKAEDLAFTAKQTSEKSAARIKSLEDQLHEMETELKKSKDQAELLTAMGAEKGVDRHTPWLPSAERDAQDPELAPILKKVAKGNELIVAISNKNYANPGGMLDSWIRTVTRAGVTNALVVALDEETKKHAESQGMTAIIMKMKISESQKDVGMNHAVSGLKFKILQRFLKLGYAVLLSDVDIIVLRNPFDHLFKDSDVESMSDGWNNQTAYGYNDVLDDPSMGWARYAHSMRVFCFNSGLFYIRPTEAALQLLETVMHRIETEAGWDQAIFNEVIFFPSRDGYTDPSVTRRVMDIYKFMNSKVLFKTVRHDDHLRSLMPVTLHANYHSNKAERLEAAEMFWVGGDDSLLMKLSEGS